MLRRESGGPSRLPSKLGVDRVNKTAALQKGEVVVKSKLI